MFNLKYLEYPYISTSINVEIAMKSQNIEFCTANVVNAKLS